jgi:hypothetical protein
MADVIELPHTAYNPDQKKSLGYFLVVDEHGEEFRLPERLFMAVDKDGNEIDPSTVIGAPVDIRVREATPEPGVWKSLFTYYVSISPRGIERIENAYAPILGDDWRHERGPEDIETEHGTVEASTFRREVR